MWSSCAFCLACDSLAKHGWPAASLASVVGAEFCLRLIPAPTLRSEHGATRVLRGFLIGMYAFATFFLVVALGIEPLGAVAAYLFGLGACLAINGLTLWGLRRRLGL